MSVDKFKFISPGVFINEIDESILPPLPERMGPLVIGRFQKGPSGRPVKVDSFKDFVSIFGNPAPGTAKSDIWRTGDMTAPTYAAYAVQAWLRNNSPCTVYRVLGDKRSDADAYGTYATAQPGWRTTKDFSTSGASVGNAGGAYGLFVMPNPDEYGGGETAATATITFAGAVTAGQTIEIVDTAGQSRIYTAATSQDTGNAREFTRQTGGADAIAGSLKACIEAAHSGTITVSSVSGGAITLTQATAGAGGNTTITENADNTTVTNFTGGRNHAVTGTLAAVWYLNNGAVVLTGTARHGVEAQGAGVFIKGDGSWTAKVLSDDTTTTKTATFNFDRDSELFIRKVFNTNPTKANDEIDADNSHYWLGETFESNLRSAENGRLKVTGSVVSNSSKMLGVVLALDGTADSNSIVWGNRLQAVRAAQTGWFISQDNRGSSTGSFHPVAHTDKLFKFHALDSGEHANRDYKISIQDIKVPTDNFNGYGTFTVLVRKGTDDDAKPEILERYSGCNLDPTSANFVRRVIGDRNYTYNADNKTLREHGDYANKSRIVRVETSDLVDQGGANGLHPFGVYGPTVPKTFRLLAHDTPTSITDNEGSGLDAIVAGSGSSNCLPTGSLFTGHPSGQVLWSAASPTGSLHHLTASIEWPSPRLRVSSSEGSLVLATKAYFGYQSSIKDVKRFDHSNLDMLRGMPHDPTGPISNETDYAWVFTLDDLKVSPDDADHAVYVSGSRANGTSYTAVSSSTTNHKEVLDQGFDQFTSPLFGGFDGFDVTENDPLRNTYLSTNQGEKSNYAFYSLKKAIDMTSDAEFVEFDVATMPGITNTSLNTSLINACEDRADALAIIDVAGSYTPKHEDNETTEANRIGSVTTAVDNIKSMNLNTSYGCVFYPWVQIRDTLTDSILYVPPSVVALGTFSSSQRKSAVWFAPAGFTRGGLSEGSAGLPVLGVRERLPSAERDKLYDANINPIASFPAEGIVIFGQKTLQVTPSALDRINVRRLLIHLKKEISRIASRILFEQNVQATWDRFKGEVVPFLESVQAGMGLTDFRVVLDDTTTTPDLIDRNVLYAKIFLKPARAIEFIALDFIITRSGASFDD